MRSFIRKQIIWSSVFLFVTVMLIGLTAYELNRVRNTFMGKPQCYRQVLDQASVLEGLLLSYELDINRMISSPRSYLPAEVETNPLRLRIEEKLENMDSMSKTCEGSYEQMLGYLELIRKDIRDIDVSSAGLIEAFSSMDNRNQTLFNVGNFTAIIQNSQLMALRHTAEFKTFLSPKTATEKEGSPFLGARMYLWVLIVISIVFCLLLLSKSYNVSRYILKLNKAVFAMRDNDFSSKEISTEMVPSQDSELFELYDAVSSIAIRVDSELKEAKGRIYDLDDELSRHKAVSSYTTAIINSLSDGIMVTNDILKVSFVNSAFEKFWRIKRSSIIDQDAKELPFIRLIKGWKEGLSKALYSSLNSTKIISLEAEYKLSEKGSSKKVSLYIIPLKDALGKEIIGTVTVTRPS